MYFYIKLQFIDTYYLTKIFQNNLKEIFSYIFNYKNILLHTLAGREFESSYSDMLINSLILLLLSNAITSRRDKSILYSRSTILILLISAFIAYDSLSLLFLAKGIGIFGGLFHTTATTNTFHIFIFLISSVILLLNSFYPRKV